MINVVCWGTGKIAEKSFLQLKDINMPIECFCDSDASKQGKQFFGYRIISPDELRERVYKVDLILITTGYWESVVQQCLDLSIEIDKVRCWDSEMKMLYSVDEMYAEYMYSANGEDIYLRNRFKGIEKGVYVDVGSCHPYRYSNTYWAYKKGWTGINIEPNLKNFGLFEKFRKRDININCGISAMEGCMRYYQFDIPELNTFDKQMAEHYEVEGYMIKAISDIKMKRLDSILKEHKIEKIDFLDIDVEGAEMDVLKSIDFNVQIECILLEQGAELCFTDIINSPGGQFLRKKGYQAVNRYGITTIYEREK